MRLLSNFDRMATDDEKVLLLRNGNEGDYETELQNLPTSELGRGILSNMRKREASLLFSQLCYYCCSSSE